MTKNKTIVTRVLMAVVLCVLGFMIGCDCEPPDKRTQAERDVDAWKNFQDKVYWQQLENFIWRAGERAKGASEEYLDKEAPLKVE